MNKIAVFAHFDKNNIIDDYVTYYLKHLKEIVNKIIFISDSFLCEEELEKISGIVGLYQAKPHGMYDFGSYKIGTELIKNPEDYDELIWCNDSCFGPLSPFGPIFEKMENTECDFWGLTENYEINYHIQSYFIVFRKKVFLSECFKEFFKSICPEKNKLKIVKKFEVGLSEKLINEGFKSKVCFPSNNSNPVNHTLVNWYYLLKAGHPLLKTSLLRFKPYLDQDLYDYKKIIAENYDYPINLMEKNISRTQNYGINKRIVKKVLTFFPQIQN